MVDSIGSDLKQNESSGSSQYRGGVDRTGHVVESTPAAEPEAHWSFDTGFFEIKSATAIVDGTAYIGTNNGIHAVDDVGSENWFYETDGLVSTTPAVVSGTVYVSCVDNHMYAFDAETGDVEWAIKIEGGHSSPAVVDGTVYVGSDDDSVYAIDAETGDVTWSFETEGMVRSSPAVVDGTVYVGSDDQSVYALAADSGDLEWRAAASSFWKVRTAPAVDDGQVYVGTNKSMHALDAETGDHRWQFEPSPSDSVSAPAVAGGTVTFGCANTGFYGVDVDSGDKQWVFAGDDAMGTPLMADGTAIVGSHDQTLYAIDIDRGEEIWTVDTDEAITAGPALSDGVFYVGGADGAVVSFRGESADTSASEYGSNEAFDASTVDDQIESTDWQVSGANPHRAGHLAGTGPTTPVIPRWKHDTNRGFDSVLEQATDGDRTYIGVSGALRAFDEEGTELWAFSTGGTIQTAPVVAGDTVYVGCADNALYAIDAETGTERWVYDADSRLAAPAIAGETVYLSSGRNVCALAADTGESRWAVDVGGLAPGSPVMAYNTLYVSAGTTLSALDPATGTPRWQHEAGGSLTATAVASETVFVGSDDGTVVALNAESGETVWKRGYDGTPETPAIAETTHGNTVYVATDTGRLDALAVDTGGQQWQYDGPAALSTPAVDGQTVYVGSEDHRIYAVDAETGDERFFFEVEGRTGQPVITDGTLHVVATAEMMALESCSSGDSDPSQVEITDPERWAVSGGNLANTSYAGGGGPTSGVEAHWSTEFGHDPAGSVTVDGGIAYVGSDTGRLDAYDAVTGERYWSMNTNRSLKSPPVVATVSVDSSDDSDASNNADNVDETDDADDTETPVVFVGDNGGTLYAFDAVTGECYWTYESTASGFSHFDAAPAVATVPGVDGKLVVVPSADNNLYAIEASTGHEQWVFETDGEIECAPIVAGSTVYVGCYDLYAVDAATGTKQWSYQPDGQQTTGIAFDDDTIYLSTNAETFHAVDADRGTELLSGRVGSDVSPPAVAGPADERRVYLTSGEHIYAFDAETGSQSWRYAVDDWIDTAPAVAALSEESDESDEPIVYAGGNGGTVHAIKNGDRLWSFDLGEQTAVVDAPTVANGTVYVVDDTGTLWALSEPDHEPTQSGALAAEAEATDAAVDVDSALPDDADSDDKAVDIPETNYVASAADDTSEPTDDQIQEAILGALCDEWQKHTREVSLSLDTLTHEVAAVLPGGSEGLVRHNVTRLDDGAYVSFEPTYETVQLRARGVAQYQESSGKQVVPDSQIMAVLEPLYEQARHSPQASSMHRDELLEEADLTAHELDRTVWFLKDVGVDIGGIYLDAGGYIEVQHHDRDPWWQVTNINKFGKQLYEELS